MVHWKSSPQAQAHRQRCAALPPPNDGERDRLAELYLTEKSVTECPPRFVAPVQHLELINRRTA